VQGYAVVSLEKWRLAVATILGEVGLVGLLLRRVLPSLAAEAGLYVAELSAFMGSSNANQ
jgi:hypothetical protein